ncbi:6-phosphofructokinase [Hydrogenimonas thermophila]|uniref:6-phosphofructokinase n=1 Tax=Hydrogenimonas thermophila TaxID=223786 RepID=UPI002936D8DC|nr:6-phosphofructokinase [Hydrogenimonas thermophila]WOE69198.1 6-phosphofructokinase [Hydrogenimonas thermophila]WOE71708.1 6-phosphofructokinase [Hydrogenimonas thermophila]
MSLAIMCSGGDAPGMNPAIKRFVDYVYEKGEIPYFVYNGLEGLIDGQIEKATHKDVAGIVHRGGAIIRSSRSKRFYEYKYRKQAYENLLKSDVTGLVVLGGDGSFRAMDLMSREFDLNFVGIPTTIDNDIYGTDICLGVDTALNVIRDALDKIRDTASTFSRAFIVEVMGRDCGYLAIVSAITSGAEICIVPEVDFNKSVVEEHLKREIANGRNYILSIVAEGTKKTNEIAQWLENSVGMESRITVLGHIQRGGSPTVYDRMLAFEFTIRAVDHLLANSSSNKVVVIKNGHYGMCEISEVVDNRYTINPELLGMLNKLD